MSDVSPDPPRLREQLGSDIRTDLVKKAMPPPLGAAKKAELLARLVAALPAASGERPAVSPARSTMKLVVAAVIPIAIGALALVMRGRTSDPSSSSASDSPMLVLPPPEPVTKPLAGPNSPEVRVDDLPSAAPSVAPSVAMDSAPAKRKNELSGLGAASSPDTLGEELRLLDVARGSLSGNPAKALQNANEHARRFPKGQLAAERELVAVEALVRLGRMTEARARGASLRRLSPALDDRVSQILGERKAP